MCKCRREKWNQNYQVSYGDTIYSIADRYKISMHDIYTNNQGIIDTMHAMCSDFLPVSSPWEHLYPGTVLVIPSL